MKKNTISYLTIVGGLTLAIVGIAIANKMPHNRAYAEISTTTTSSVVETSTTESTTTTQESTTTTSEVAVLIPPTTTINTEGFKCPQYAQTAIEAGWGLNDLKTLDFIMYRESRCHKDSHNPYDPSGGSYGLVQLNGYFCRKNTYNPNGFFQNLGIITNCEDLFNPVINLRAAKALFDYEVNRGQCGWSPWVVEC